MTHATSLLSDSYLVLPAALNRQTGRGEVLEKLEGKKRVRR